MSSSVPLLKSSLAFIGPGSQKPKIQGGECEDFHCEILFSWQKYCSQSAEEDWWIDSGEPTSFLFQQSVKIEEGSLEDSVVQLK